MPFHDSATVVSVLQGASGLREQGSHLTREGWFPNSSSPRRPALVLGRDPGQATHERQEVLASIK